MARIAKDDFMVTHDEEIGVVYAPKKGVLKTTSPEHADVIENILLRYHNDEVSEEEKIKIENYMEASMDNAPDLPIAECLDLRERDFIRRLEIILINECNLRCKYCYAHGGTYDMESQKMTPDQACIYLEKLLVGRYRYVDIISFFGGEPTLCPDTIQAICGFFKENVKHGILEKMPQFLMVSNGTLIDKNMVRIIDEYDISVTISIDGPPEINDLIRVDKNGNGTYAQIARGIELLKQAGKPPVLLEATYTTKYKELGYTKENIQEYLKQAFEIDRVMVADCCDGGIQEGLTYIETDTKPQDIEKNPFPDIGFTHKCLTSGVFSDMGCDVAYGSITLVPTGELYPCHFFVNKNEYKLGSYNNGVFEFSNYEKVKNKFENLRNLKNFRCKDCWAKPVCMYCPAQFLLEDENSISVSCNSRKMQQKQLILRCVKTSLT